MSKAIHLAALLTLMPLVAAAEETALGTLFYSPAERTAIARGRSGETTEASKNFSVGGIVKRSGGRSTVWVNGSPLADRQPVPQAPTPVIQSEHHVLLDGKAVRVGESIDVASGQRSDVAPSGAVSRGKRP